ncbi:hypothetical protein F4680DRAFT_113322 [Xylaria scruposa]|nr:hypothetical protein F4680DRAFT_113322 [Xylaria scruposa]
MMQRSEVELGLIGTEGGKPKKIEEYRRGYPRFAALIAANPDFSIYRQFRRLRARLLLLAQEKIRMLEHHLDQVDENETCPLFLGQSRSDTNEERHNIISMLYSAITDYDSLLESTHRVLSLGHAQPRDISSVQNWINGTGCISKDETAYLDHDKELISLAFCKDGATKKLEDWVEDLFVDRYEGFRSNPHHDLSESENVFLYSGQLIKHIAKAIMLILISFLLLLPVVICMAIDSPWGRICVIIASTVAYLAILAQLTNSRMIELILAGATFATILTVFISV